MKSQVTSNNSTIVNGFQINSEVYKFINSRRVNHFDPSNGFQEAWRFNTTRLEQTNSYFKVSPESLFFTRRKKRHRRSQNPLTEEGWLPLKKKHMAFFGSSSGSSNKQIDTHNMEHQQNPDEVSSCFHARSIELLRAILELLEGVEFTQNVVTVTTTTTIITTCGMCKHRNILLTKSWSKSSSLHVGEACYNDIESQISYSYELYIYIHT